ncbi:MAG: nitroreductase family protein [Desulfarculus sp.]|nr:nitroreductase family protein [Desulfarculus sp.]
MKRAVATVIDPDLCTGCGLCLAVCPSGTLSLVEGKARVTGERSLGCGHCQAVCPTGAARVEGLEELSFHSFTPDRAWLPPGQGDPAQLVRLMLSRRSCRNFQERRVPRELLEDLVRAGQAAPSGTNSQHWTFTILPHRQAVLALGRRVGDFFAELNRLAAKAWLRQGLRLLGRPQLDNYYRDHYQSVSQAMEEWRTTGRERLFHGAPAAILVGSRPGGSCPAEDALLASQNILLAAHALGLGTCLVGFAVEALKRRPDLKPHLGLPPQETVHAVIALGFPAERYARQAGRWPLEPRWWEPPE